MNQGSLLSLIIEDYHAHGSDWTRPGFRAIAVYRFGVWRMTIRTRYLRALLTLIYRAGYRFCRNIYGIELPYTAAVGRGVIIEHQGGIVIHGASVIGDNCILRQNCTLGIKTTGALSDAPILMQGVSLGAGAVVLGRVTVGENAIIGANAVVIQDVPAGAVAVGIPAQVVTAGSLKTMKDTAATD